MYFVTHNKRGISALQLSFIVGVTYKTAWYMLRQIRVAVGQRDSQHLLEGMVEFDDIYFGGPTAGKKRGRGTEKSKVFIALSLDKNGNPKFVKMAVTGDLKKESVNKELGDGIGWFSFHPVTTPLIYIAEDGKTARGLFYCVGQETRPSGDGLAIALWIPEKIGVDFVKEDDGWKIWHIMIANDLVCEAGTCYEDGPVYTDDATDPVIVEFGKPTISKRVHEPFFNWWDDYPSQPRPYESWSDDESYGPEGYHESKTYQMKSGEGHNYK